jgi:prepilin-type N-terminal cleavage/methylation domain-containing protein
MKRNEEGFTIIESLTALAILTVALVVLYGAGATALRTFAHASSVDRAILLAQSKLDEIEAMQKPLPERSEGAFSDGIVRWTVIANAIPENGTSHQHLVLQAIHLDLQWHDGLRRRSLDVQTRHLGVAP